MGRVLVTLTEGIESPTKATLAMLVAEAALAEGHDVSVFFAGDAVGLLRPATRDAVQGVGLGSFGEHLEAVVVAGGTLYASKLSGVARGIGDGDVGGLPVTLTSPAELVKLSVAADSTLSY